MAICRACRTETTHDDWSSSCAEILEQQRDDAYRAIEMWQREVSGRDADIDRLRAKLANVRQTLINHTDQPLAWDLKELLVHLDAEFHQE